MEKRLAFGTCIKVLGKDLLSGRCYNERVTIINSSEYFDGTKEVYTYRIKVCASGQEGYINEADILS